MSPEGFQKALRSFARRRPFRPFRIEFITGEEIVARHPEAVDIRGSVLVYISPGRHLRMFDSHSVCQLKETEKEIEFELE
ncbi:MAG TPA: hypothetical protein VGI40_21250 [Pirellulaceae bacterium]|jgi:hypothetical protein